jgi:hypothetical protein
VILRSAKQIVGANSIFSTSTLTRNYCTRQTFIIVKEKWLIGRKPTHNILIKLITRTRNGGKIRSSVYTWN